MPSLCEGGAGAPQPLGSANNWFTHSAKQPSGFPRAKQFLAKQHDIDLTTGTGKQVNQPGLGKMRRRTKSPAPILFSCQGAKHEARIAPTSPNWLERSAPKQLLSGAGLHELLICSTNGCTMVRDAMMHTCILDTKRVFSSIHS